MQNASVESDDEAGAAIGIDLGTTYSVVAALNDQSQPYSIANYDGEFITPTAILVDNGGIVIGQEAVRASVIEPTRFADCFKRDMGASVYRRGLQGIEVPPQVLNAFVLRQLKEDAEREIGPVSKAVITVPAFFDEARRQATQDAGKIAGLEVLDIINEPTAAALAYGFRSGLLRQHIGEEGQPSRVLVYDLGGGTFDVTILEISGKTYRTLATDGDVQLGGKDFDERIVEYLCKAFIEEHGIDARSNPEDAAQLWIDAEKAKRTLSKRTKTSVVVASAGVRSRVDLDRDSFEELTCDLLVRTETTTSLVVRQAGLKWDDIDRVLLVGGSSRMPAVAAMLERLTGIAPDRSMQPDEAVAHGAAIHANNLAGAKDGQAPACQLINVNSHSLGVRGIDKLTKRLVNGIMIPKNTPLPCGISKTFRTSQADQKSVRVVVLEGESHQPSECIELGECVIRGLPAGMSEGSKVEVTYRYSADGRLTVSAKACETRQSARVEIVRKNIMELEDLQTWQERILAESESVKESDPGAILRRLDELYSKVGEKVAGVKVPGKLQRPHDAARNAILESRQNKVALDNLNQSKGEVTTHSELVQLSAKLAKARESAERSSCQASFACVVLGRECYKLGLMPSSLSAIRDEIKALRKELER